jgi:hypothetical protein
MIAAKTWAQKSCRRDGRSAVGLLSQLLDQFIKLHAYRKSQAQRPTTNSAPRAKQHKNDIWRNGLLIGKRKTHAGAITMKYLLTFIAALAILAAASYAASARCSYECKDSKLITKCTSPTDIEKCKGACLGNMCIGFCSPDAALAEQNQIQHERKTYEFRYPRRRLPDQAIEH